MPHANRSIGLAAIAMMFAVLMMIGGDGNEGWRTLDTWSLAGIAVYVAAILVAISVRHPSIERISIVLALIAGSMVESRLLDLPRPPAVAASALLASLLFCLWQCLSWLEQTRRAAVLPVIPFGFFLAFLCCWQFVTQMLHVPSILLPAPTMIGVAIWDHGGTLLSDFNQTVLHSALRGYLLGCGLGFLVALLFDRFPRVSNALLPYCMAMGAVPMIGIAPIMVMWFGFGWESKAAVVAIISFFPMLVGTLTGLKATDRLHLELMSSYAASYTQTLFKVRLVNARGHIVTALKINSTFAIVTAIVAEFFGTPVSGMGFRISAEVARMNLDLVWATIAVGALAGSVTYGGLSFIEQYTASRQRSSHRSGK